jgi:formate/nitrite transporter FocA (FNT family)
MYLWYLVIAAVIGAVFAGLLGWLGSGEKFAPRKFASTVLRAILAGAIVAVGYIITPAVTGVLGIVVVFLAGAGVDVLGNRLASSVTASQPGDNSPPTK